MRFIWVNGQMPASSFVCAVSARPSRASYLRHDYHDSVLADDHAIRPINEHEAGAILKSTLEPFQEVQSPRDWLQEIQAKVLVTDSAVTIRVEPKSTRNSNSWVHNPLSK